MGPKQGESFGIASIFQKNIKNSKKIDFSTKQIDFFLFIFC